MSREPLEFSVIIPTCNRSVAAVEKCLEALSRQTLAKDTFEVILSDDGSEGEAKEKAESSLRTKFKQCRYLWQPNAGQGAARNHAIAQARGRVLFFLNDDAIAIPTLLEEHKHTHQKYPAPSDAVLGKFTISPELPYSIFAKLHSDASYALWEGQTELSWHAFYTCNISVKKVLMAKFGVFDEKLRFYEDVELGERLSHHGLRIIYNPNALAYHYHFLDESQFLNYASFHAKALAAWYKKSPHLKKELVRYGFYFAESFSKRAKHFLGDLLINRFTIPLLIPVARFSSRSQEKIALDIYKKIYSTLLRKTIRKELTKNKEK